MSEKFLNLLDKVIKDLKDQQWEVYDIIVDADEVLLVIEKLQKQN